MRIRHKTDRSAEGRADAGLSTPMAGWATVWDILPPLRAQDRSCCCVAQAAFQVMIPAGETRPRPTQLLLCRHHYQRSRIALGKIEAAAYDADGCRVILPGDTVNQVGERTAPAVASQLP